jgi:hypothetical protein
MLLLDIAVQSGQVANQSRIFALRGEVRARLNTAYMTCAFLGASAGSWLGIRAYTALGWIGIPPLVALAAALALGRHLTHRRRPRTRDHARYRQQSTPPVTASWLHESNRRGRITSSGGDLSRVAAARDGPPDEPLVVPSTP